MINCGTQSNGQSDSDLKDIFQAHNNKWSSYAESEDLDGITSLYTSDAIIDGNATQYFQEKVKAITLANFSAIVSNAGLKIIDIFGNYKLDDFNATTSDRLILICKK